MDRRTRKAIQELRPIIFRIVVDSLDEVDMKDFVLEDELYVHIVQNCESLNGLFGQTGKEEQILSLMDYLIDYYSADEQYEKCETIYDIKMLIS